MNLSEAEKTLLSLAKDGVLISTLPDTVTVDVFGCKQPGLTTLKAMIRKDLVFVTEEDPITLDDGTVFTFTPSLGLTDKGAALWEEQTGQQSGWIA